jgi:hypothetical protein
MIERSRQREHQSLEPRPSKTGEWQDRHQLAISRSDISETGGHERSAVRAADLKRQGRIRFPDVVDNEQGSFLAQQRPQSPHCILKCACVTEICGKRVRPHPELFQWL